MLSYGEKVMKCLRARWEKETHMCVAADYWMPFRRRMALGQSLWHCADHPPIKSSLSRPLAAHPQEWFLPEFWSWPRPLFFSPWVTFNVCLHFLASLYSHMYFGSGQQAVEGLGGPVRFSGHFSICEFKREGWGGGTHQRRGSEGRGRKRRYILGIWRGRGTA